MMMHGFSDRRFDKKGAGKSVVPWAWAFNFELPIRLPIMLQTSTNHFLGSQRPSKAGILSSVKKYQQYRAPFNREDWKVDVRTKAAEISV
jgi:hypothetical protein